MQPAFDRYIGLMSGTSLDGVDAVLAGFTEAGACTAEAIASLPFPEDLRRELLALNQPGPNEIERCQLAGNRLATVYAECIATLLRDAGLTSTDIEAIGCHGQTVRHRPDLGFTVQIGNPALLAELTGIRVVADFRSRDVAAGGQGAPLVPAFHQAVFAHSAKRRVIVNIGGISNISDLPARGEARGFDCGPGNLLMDGWAQKHIGLAYDQDGAWAAGGEVIPELLDQLLAHPFFAQPPPKSTGRDDFHLAWLESQLAPQQSPRDIQATLLELTARTIADAIKQYCPNTDAVYVCGGGVRNIALMSRLTQLLQPCPAASTADLGIAPEAVEAAAFAWLARQCLCSQPGNLPAATGAAGPRILGAVYHA